MTDEFESYEMMPIHDEYIPEDKFSQFIETMPQVCVDILFETADGILLVKRAIEPSIWFWPGGRLYKGERLAEAARRVAREELGVGVSVRERYGPYAHFWEDSAVKHSPSRHTVNAVFRVVPENREYEIQLDQQHSEYQFVTEPSQRFHEYVNLYLTETDVL